MLQYSILRFKSAGSSKQERNVLYAGQVEQLDERAGYAQTEAAVRGCAVAEEVEILAHCFGFDAVFLYVLFEVFVAVFALCAAGDLYALKQQVVRFGKRGVVVLFHRIECARLGREVYDEYKIAAVLFLGVLANKFFTKYIVSDSVKMDLVCLFCPRLFIWHAVGALVS